MQIELSKIVEYCHKRLNLDHIKDFPGIHNGLQFSNQGHIRHILAAVDANIHTFQLASQYPSALLFVHHGLTTQDLFPATSKAYQRIHTLISHDTALFCAHLPLDCHPEIGNNALLAQWLNLEIDQWIVPFQNNPIVPLCTNTHYTQQTLQEILKSRFEQSLTAIEYGPQMPKKIAICSGSGSSTIESIIHSGADTLITGELKQSCFSQAQDHGLNLYACGHYATETIGVDALAKEVATQFNLPYTFIHSTCPL